MGWKADPYTNLAKLKTRYIKDDDGKEFLSYNGYIYCLNEVTPPARELLDLVKKLIPALEFYAIIDDDGGYIARQALNYVE